MKSKILFLANEIRILQVKWLFILLIAMGIIFSVIGLLIILDYLYIFYIAGKLLFGIGIILFSCGLLLLFNRNDLIISINSSKGIIEIKNVYMTKKVSTAFPIVHFSKITIFEHLKYPYYSKSRSVYEISLDGNTPASLLLAEFKQKERALDFVNKLHELILLDIHYQNKIYKRSEFKLKFPHIPDNIQFSKTTRIRKIQKKSEIILKWHSFHTFLSFLFLAGIFYGCYYIIHFVIYREQGLNLQNYFEYILSGCIALVILIIFFITYFKTKTIRLDRESIQYYISILGMKIHKMNMQWDDVAHVQSTICSKQLCVYSKKGNEIIQELNGIIIKKHNSQISNDILSRWKALAGQMLVLDVAALPVSDRIRIEQDILDFML